MISSRLRIIRVAFGAGIMTQTRTFTVRRGVPSPSKEVAMSTKGAFPRCSLRQLAALAALLVFASAAAQAQVSLRVRGTITGLEGDVLSVKTREGRDLKLNLSDKTAVVAAKALKLEELKPGD